MFEQHLFFDQKAINNAGQEYFFMDFLL